MTPIHTRRQANRLLAAAGLAACARATTSLAAAHPNYTSPYWLEYSYPLENLIGDLIHGERGNPHLESAVPHGVWNSHDVRRHYHGWGPPQRLYPPLSGLELQPLQWRRERAIATAARFFGYGYQHHHIPDWNPPDNWPWKETCAGHNGKGVDCSNLTSFVYNQAFGIKVSSAIERQSELRHASEGSAAVSNRDVELPDDYEERQQVLRTGDLLFVRGREGGHVTHVVLWVGSIGRSRSDVPLIIDSHGSGVDDDNGQAIPCGVHLRPFRERSWYNRCASHAHRIFV